MESEEFPTPSPTLLLEAETAVSPNPCSDNLSKKESLFDDLTLRYDIVVDNDRQVFCSELQYDGEGWLGFGVSETGDMIGSTAVIGLPGNDDPTIPNLYSLDGKTNSLVKLLPEEEQTLLGARITQVDGMTVLKFAKYIDEPDDDFAIKVPGVTTFIYTAADNNEFGYHGMKRGSVSLVLSNAKSWKQAKREQRGDEKRISDSKKNKVKKGKQRQL